MFQLTSNLEVQFIQKKRNIGTTLCEFLSHLILLTLLVIGYNTSVASPYAPASYNVVELQIPPPFINSNVAVESIIPTNKNSSSISISSISKLINFNGVLQFFDQVLKQPIPVPSFDLYITIAKAITNANKNNGNVNLIESTGTGQRYQNLLSLGVIHFAPYPSVLVDNYITYMLNHTTQFKNMKYYIHSSESNAVDYILNNLQERTFALIVFREISNKKINYFIRQNYTALPNTNFLVSPQFKGLNTIYEKYYLNGFLTLQDSIDQWAFNYTGTSRYNVTNRPVKLAGTCAVMPKPWAFPYPIYAYNQNPYFVQVGPLLGLALTSMLYII